MTMGPATRTASDVIKHVQRQFGDEAAVQVTDEDIIRYINTGQVEILNKNPILKARATTNIFKGQQQYELPEDILNIQSLTLNGAPVAYRSFQEAQEYIAKHDPKNTLEGDPSLWYEWGGSINLYPKPDKDITDGLVIYYVKLPTPITTGVDKLSIPDRYYNILVHYVMQQVYEMDEDWTASGNKASQFEAGVNTLAEEENNSSRNVYPRITVLEEDGW